MNYKIVYENHVHGLDGKYDRKISEGERVVSGDYRYRCLPWWKYLNKVEEFSIKQIIHHLKVGYFGETSGRGKVLAQYLLSEGETIAGRYYYEKIISITKI